MANVGIGDELIVTGQARMMQQTDSRKVRVQYEKGKRRWCPLWDNNPRLAKHDEVGDFQILEPRNDYLRPYCAKKTPERWTWKAYRPPQGEVYFHSFEKAFGYVNTGYVVLGPNLKAGASPNKQWGHERWELLSRMIAAIGLKPITIGATGQKRLTGSNHVETTIRQAAALIERARAVVTNEGALHHIASAVGTPAVVIYGGYISPAVTGYDGQRSLFVGDDLGCGMRVPCKHCEAAMAKITPKMVLDQLAGVLGG